MDFNFSKLVSNRLRNIGLEDVNFKSNVWNSVVNVMKNERNIDVSKYLVSITVSWTTILIKTNKPIINAELTQHQDKIYADFKQKMKEMWFTYKDFEIKYL